MKKGSTAAGRQSRNISGQQLTIGLDLGDRNSCYGVLDQSGQIQFEPSVATSDVSQPGSGRQDRLGKREERLRKRRFDGPSTISSIASRM